MGRAKETEVPTNDVSGKRGVIDVEASGAALPGELLRRITTAHPYLIGINLIAEKDGTQQLLGSEFRKRWKSAPPDAAPDEIATEIVGWVQELGQKRGPNTRYSVKMSIRGAEGQESTRWASLRIVIGDDGELEVLDLLEYDSKKVASLYQESREFYEGVADSARKSLDAVVRATQSWANAGEMVKSTFEALATAGSSSAQLELEKLKIMSNMHHDEQDYAFRKTRINRLFNWWDEFSEPARQPFADFIKSQVDRMNGPGYAADVNPLAAWHDALNPEAKARFRKVWTDDQWSILEALQKAEGSDAASELMGKLQSTFEPRDRDTLEDRIVDAVGAKNARALSQILRA